MKPVAHDRPRAQPAHHARIMHSAPAEQVVIDDRRYLYFAGTGYLGLQSHPALIAAAHEALDRYGIHTATTRNGYGTSPPVREVEQRACALLGAEAASYLVSGYATNACLLAALAETIDVAFVDAHAHDSLREAAIWLERGGKRIVTFRHCDPEHLHALIQTHGTKQDRAYVLTDGVFAVSGDVAPLGEYYDMLRGHGGAALVVDDAHGLGVLGRNGRGSLEHAGFAAETVNRTEDESQGAEVRLYCTATLSKAIGGHGGIVAGSRAFIEQLHRASGWHRGASAPAAPVAAATAKGLELALAESGLRQALAGNVALLRGKLRALRLDVAHSPSPIVGFRLETSASMQRVFDRLSAEGILIGFARDYSGAGPDGMLRIAVFATHTAAMIERLTNALADLLGQEQAC